MKNIATIHLLSQIFAPIDKWLPQTKELNASTYHI